MYVLPLFRPFRPAQNMPFSTSSCSFTNHWAFYWKRTKLLQVDDVKFAAHMTKRVLVSAMNVASAV